MSKSESGRLVVEIDPDLQRKLYAVLALEQKTLKEWFIESSSSYVKERLKAELDILGSEKE